MKKRSLKQGFTLIELLVVIAVIGILASVVLVSLNSARAKARDARRLSDMRTIQTALEMYYSDNGRYPPSAGVDGCSSYSSVPNASWCNSFSKNGSGRWIANGALAPYLPADPVDPAPEAINPTTVAWSADNTDGGTYYYVNIGTGCSSSTQSYTLIAGMEIVANRKNTYKGCDGGLYVSGGTYIVGNSVQ